MQDLGAAQVIRKRSVEGWRVSFRQDEPETAPLPEALLRRRLDHQRHAKSKATASRRSSELETLLALKKARARKNALREIFARPSDSGGRSSSSSTSSDKGAL